MQAMLDGYADAVALDESGLLSEGSGQNLFLVRDNVIFTPSLGSSVLQGITRDTVSDPRQDLGFELRETSIPREFLYLADEAFFCGTAVEITPVRSFDKITVGTATRADYRGPPTAVFRDFARRSPDTHGWLTPVGQAVEPIIGIDSLSSPTRGMHVNDLLKLAVEKGASDLHLKVGSYPMARFTGTSRRSATRSSSITRISSRWPASIMSTAQRQKFKDSQEVDLAYSVAGLGRFRCNVFQQRGTIGVVLPRHSRQGDEPRRARPAAGHEEDRRRRTRPGAGHRHDR
jgi:hypothetical protein